MQSTTLQLRNLAIGYAAGNHTKYVSENLNATIKTGQLTCLLGQNGVGKSTLLRTLSAFQPPLSGEIELLGKPITSYADGKLSRHLGVVLTERLAMQGVTVSELVAMGRSPYTGFWGKLSASDHAIVAESMQLVGIEHLAERRVETLSDGERQKAMISKALAQQTPIIFLDEPTAFLDFPSKVEVMQLLHSLTRTEQKTIFLSTHDLELALQLSDDLWLMHPTEDLRTGTPEDLALNGVLTHFFNRPGILFDENVGLYRIAQPTHSKVQLSGKGVSCLMARKALLRIGIEATAEEMPLSVYADEKGFLVSTLNNSSVIYPTIVEMLAAITVIYAQSPQESLPTL